MECLCVNIVMFVYCRNKFVNRVKILLQFKVNVEVTNHKKELPIHRVCISDKNMEVSNKLVYWARPIHGLSNAGLALYGRALPRYQYPRWRWMDSTHVCSQIWIFSYREISHTKRGRPQLTRGYPHISIPIPLFSRDFMFPFPYPYSPVIPCFHSHSLPGSLHCIWPLKKTVCVRISVRCCWRLGQTQLSVGEHSY